MLAGISLLLGVGALAASWMAYRSGKPIWYCAGFALAGFVSMYSFAVRLRAAKEISRGTYGPLELDRRPIQRRR